MRPLRLKQVAHRNATMLTGCLLGGLLANAPVALAQQASMSSDQNTNNQAIATPNNNQTNQSSSFSTGGDLIQQNINPAIGKLGVMTVGKGGISCESASVYLQLGVYPYDNQYYAVFDDNVRDKDWMPQGAFGVSIPFGPQVSSCVEAMRHQTRQVTIATEAGILRHCLTLRPAVQQLGEERQRLAHAFPTLAKDCREIWKPAADLQPWRDSTSAPVGP
jgi:hypothetical protein